ncbi:nitroreductase family deazaflavin-dependent oxidoreductase [Streptomyces sp. NPDC127036]|uniref:nitroreductase family deazaflavin-dependent oxidoreductase n=1 Tax=Streptomyces sp. NPDC127036 TaxID=3347112 RepID=UPI0036660B25
MSERLQRNQSVIDEFRSAGGIVGGDFEGVPLLLLTTTGARTGKPRTTPLTYLRDGHRLVVFAANGGREKHPAWYHNLFANPSASVEIDSDTYAVTATEIGGAERERLWERQLEYTPYFADFEDRAGRRTPVLALVRTTD